MQITTIGLDIAKNVFQVHGIDAVENVVVRKQLRRSHRRRLQIYFAPQDSYYSITSSARRRNVSEIVSPSALAVVRLTTRSNRVGCSTGMSAAAGFGERI